MRPTCKIFGERQLSGFCPNWMNSVLEKKNDLPFEVICCKKRKCCSDGPCLPYPSISIFSQWSKQCVLSLSQLCGYSSFAVLSPFYNSDSHLHHRKENSDPSHTLFLIYNPGGACLSHVIAKTFSDCSKFSVLSMYKMSLLGTSSSGKLWIKSVKWN